MLLNSAQSGVDCTRIAEAAWSLDKNLKSEGPTRLVNRDTSVAFPKNRANEGVARGEVEVVAAATLVFQVALELIRVFPVLSWQGHVRVCPLQVGKLVFLSTLKVRFPQLRSEIPYSP